MTTTSIRTAPPSHAQTYLRALGRFSALPPFVIVAIACIVLAPNFLSSSNVANMLINGSITAIIAYGMTIVIALRGLDLSVGSLQGLSACLTAVAYSVFGTGLGIAAGLGIGLAVGVVNGVLVAYLRVPSFVATLGMLGILRGVALLVTNGQTIQGGSSFLNYVVNGRVVGVPIPFLLALALLGVWLVVFYYTPFGRHVVAVGGSPEAASDSGIRVRRTTVIAFALSGLSAGVGGVLLMGQLSNVTGDLGTGLELQVIAIAVLGGTSLAGGNGNLIGTLVASLLLAMIDSALNLLNVPSFYQYLAIGLLLVAALSLDSVRARVSRRLVQNS
ncbi:MAG TPA: ABC transporter permease [Galbitalea sp.]|jgi:ribose transport system permease protein|nr:ABC transporter permease [Galbitalea sp.]